MKDTNKNGMKVYAVVSTFVFETLVIIAVFIFIGYWLDKLLETSFIFLLLSILFGIFFSVFNLIKKVTKLEDKNGKK